MVDDISLMRRAHAIAGQVLPKEQTQATRNAAIQNSERIDGLVLLDVVADASGIDPLAFEEDFVGLLGCAYRMITGLLLCRLNNDSCVPVYDRLYELNLPASMVEEIYSSVEHIWDLVIVLTIHAGLTADIAKRIVEVEAARRVIGMCFQIEIQTESSELDMVLEKLQRYTRGHLKRMDTG